MHTCNEPCTLDEERGSKEALAESVILNGNLQLSQCIPQGDQISSALYGFFPDLSQESLRQSRLQERGMYLEKVLCID